jgi:hypothetical protein
MASNGDQKLMLATERLLEIEERFGAATERIVPLELDGQTLRLVLYLPDGTNLRLIEQWNGSVLERYSYYWLTATNELKIGWDNAPHHDSSGNFSPSISTLAAKTTYSLTLRGHDKKGVESRS